MMNIIIVEDSVAAAKRLYQHLSKHPDINVIDVFDNIESAWLTLQSGGVDGVFLDIHFDLSGGGDTDGLTLARQMSWLAPTPWIIFVSGYPEHALDAINLLPPNVLRAYLVNPYTEMQLINAIDNIRRNAPSSPQASTLPELIEVKYKQRKINKMNKVDNAIALSMVNFAEIRYVHQDMTVNVHLMINDEPLTDVNINLANWGKHLLSEKVDYFQRIHRQTIVNLKCANGLKPDPERIDGFLALFKDCADELEIGGKYLKAYKEAIRTGRRVDI